MRISKSKLSFICLTAGLILTVQTAFASVVVPIPKDGTSLPPPDQGNGATLVDDDLCASALLSDTDLTVFFAYPVGNALVTVVDENQQIVYQTLVNTVEFDTETIVLDGWGDGKYTLIVSYETTTQRGSFVLY